MDRNPPITNHKPWPFEPVKVKFCFLRGPLRWLTAAKNAIAKVAFELQNSHVCEKRSNLVSEFLIIDQLERHYQLASWKTRQWLLCHRWAQKKWNQLKSALLLLLVPSKEMVGYQQFSLPLRWLFFGSGCLNFPLWMIRQTSSGIFLKIKEKSVEWRITERKVTTGSPSSLWEPWTTLSYLAN